MRVLFVAPYLPTPGSGGRTRLQNVMARVARSHDVRLVGIVVPDQDRAQNPYPGTMIPAPPPRPRPGGLRGLARFYRERARSLPTFVSYLDLPEMARAVRDQCESFRPDVVFFNTTEMGLYMSHVPPGPLRALDLQDVSSRWIGRAAAEGRTSQQRALMWVELLKTRRFETRIARAADVVFVTSEVERAFLSGLAGVDAVEVPNGVDAAAFVPMPDVAEEDDVLLFVGPLTSQANDQALRWFCREVLPILARDVPGVRVDVVGAPAGERWPERVRLLGRVDDVRPHLARAPVSISPIRVGSGTRYKILEALSMERAVVSTAIGAEGLGVRDGEHLLLADDAERFAAACARALRDPALRASMGRAGRAHVAARYDWSILVERIEQAWEAARARATGR